MGQTLACTAAALGTTAGMTSDTQRTSAPGGPPETVVTSVPIPTSDDDHDVVITNETSGPGNELGGGEFPSPSTPPVAPEDVDHDDVSAQG